MIRWVWLLVLAPCLAAESPSFAELLARPIALRSELSGVHPRLFFTTESLPSLRDKAKASPLWRDASRELRAAVETPEPAGSPKLDESGVQQRAAYTLAQAVFLYSIERKPEQLAAARKWLDAIISYPDWGYSYRTPNVDLPPAHLLYAVAFAYDGLYNDLDPPTRERVRTKLVRQSRLMYEHFRFKPKKVYSFSQNHTFIPMTGLALAAFALIDEVPEAIEWAKLARAIYHRTFEVMAPDGYYYEGFHYAVYSLHWMVRYLDALAHTTGEDLYPQLKEKLVPMKFYFAQSMLPTGQAVFDFGDTGRGTTDRLKPNPERLNTGYEALYALAARYQDPELQGVAEWLRTARKTTTYEPVWAFYAHDAKLTAKPVSSLATHHYFKDAETVFWRSGWEESAVAFAFRCGPPEGHHAEELRHRIPEWRMNTGHAHPDANSFIWFAHGRYLTGDSGYTGTKYSKHHNTVLINGRGQAFEGKHEAFKGFPYERLNELRVTKVRAYPDRLDVTGEAASAFPEALGVQRWTRRIRLQMPSQVAIVDTIELTSEQPVTWVLHSDREFRVDRENGIAETDLGGVRMRVQSQSPHVSLTSVPNDVTDAGRPGSVELGKPEVRGFALHETTAPAKSHELIHLLTVVTAADTKPSDPSQPLDQRNDKGTKP
jgi:hypothetical protein